MRAVNGSADAGSSTASESSDGEQNHPTVNGYRRLNGASNMQNGGLVNGYHHPKPRDCRRANRVSRARLSVRNQTSQIPLNLKTVRVCLRKIEKSDIIEARAQKATMEQIQLLSRGRSVETLNEGARSLVVDHSKLRDLLNRAVSKTEGCEVEPLEKLYALLAQCIYRHRNSYNKTQLVQEMKKEIDVFSQSTQ